MKSVRRLGCFAGRKHRPADIRCRSENYSGLRYGISSGCLYPKALTILKKAQKLRKQPAESVAYLNRPCGQMRLMLAQHDQVEFFTSPRQPQSATRCPSNASPPFTPIKLLGVHLCTPPLLSPHVPKLCSQPTTPSRLSFTFRAIFFPIS